MKDRRGRTIDYLRISVTDRCNLRCAYCMPAEGAVSVPRREILSFDEIIRIAGICSKKGITKVRLTGGEPLVRKDVCDLVARLKKVPGIRQVMMTTNGILLGQNFENLMASGLDGINISIDTLNPEKYRKLTGGGCLDTVLRAFERCASSPFIKTKINTVLLGEENADEISDIAQLAQTRPVDVRFIELMPIGPARKFRGLLQEMAAADLRKTFGEPLAYDLDSAEPDGPARYYGFNGFEGRIGFITPFSHAFCGSCNRIRLTPEGVLKLCLYHPDGVDLKSLLRGGFDDGAISCAIDKAVWNKPVKHGFGSKCDDGTGVWPMFRIGG